MSSEHPSVNDEINDPGNEDPGSVEPLVQEPDGDLPVDEVEEEDEERDVE